MRYPQSTTLLLMCYLLVSACASSGAITDDVESHEHLVVTDIVSTLIQVPGFSPVNTTLQVSRPDTDFGIYLVAALVTAGYGLQYVAGDQGPNYVAYAVRHASTDAGAVNDYLIRINELEIRREYRTTAEGIYPSSLMFVGGVGPTESIAMNDWFFAEQGGDQYFLSGVDSDRQRRPESLQEYQANANHQVKAGRRTPQARVLAVAVDAMHEAQRLTEAQSVADLERLQKLVVLFPDNRSLRLGSRNKAALRKFQRETRADDVIEIVACSDIDGQNRFAVQREVRIKEELLSLGIPLTSIYRSPCVRADYRHQSDDSPVPVVLYLNR